MRRWRSAPPITGILSASGYSALYTVVLNLVLAIVLTPVFRALRAQKAPADETAADYYA